VDPRDAGGGARSLAVRWPSACGSLEHAVGVAHRDDVVGAPNSTLLQRADTRATEAWVFGGYFWWW
jgi:hypothetical protein